MTHDTNEDEINAAMSKFGIVEKVYIPTSEYASAKNKIAIVRFKNAKDSDRAIEEKTIIINSSELKIERALKKN